MLQWLHDDYTWAILFTVARGFSSNYDVAASFRSRVTWPCRQAHGAHLRCLFVNQNDSIDNELVGYLFQKKKTTAAPSRDRHHISVRRRSRKRSLPSQVIFSRCTKYIHTLPGATASSTKVSFVLSRIARRAAVRHSALKAYIHKKLRIRSPASILEARRRRARTEATRVSCELWRTPGPPITEDAIYWGHWTLLYWFRALPAHRCVWRTQRLFVGSLRRIVLVGLHLYNRSCEALCYTRRCRRETGLGTSCGGSTFSRPPELTGSTHRVARQHSMDQPINDVVRPHATTLPNKNFSKPSLRQATDLMIVSKRFCAARFLFHFF